ncbi:MAG: hypothetical protein GDA40_11085 [Rhodobacteraceae bacterium]|nr:hypothetical protein [Paracoccaceae bacterium]
MLWGDLADRTKALSGVFANPSGDFAELGIGDAGISFGEGDKIVSVPDCEGEIRKKVGPAPVTGLGIDHHRFDGQRIKLPFPPIALFAPRKIG